MLHWVRRIIHEYRTSVDVEEYGNYYVSSIATSVDQLESSQLGIETLLIRSRSFSKTCSDISSMLWELVLRLMPGKCKETETKLSHV